MEIIKIHHPIDNNFKSSDKCVLAMGYFDGIHLGHQKVIEKAKEIAIKKHLDLALLTYDHKPSIVYKQISSHERRNITLNDYKMKLFKTFGVKKVFLVNYSFDFQNQSPIEFVNNYLIRFNVDTVVAGVDHTYGSKDADMKNMIGYSDGRFDVCAVDLSSFNDKKISSTAIRHNLDQGDIKTVNNLLGRPFKTFGLVVHGLARGRELGYPTANIEHSEFQWLPSIGIYVVNITIGDKTYNGMVSIGRNVTFGDKNPITVEINILDFDHNIYGENVSIDWLYRIRGEVKFDGVDNLINQLSMDEKFTRKFFNKKQG
ncbi:riboflavin biosynthesis protein RibF [Apilactobacillus timberlakei]|uniref:riboflavin biosynthesis protein RibF n=1 Tax=Apilactobacillus timberlakei TaxID=2008380 RepID=UPI00112CCFA6|nr:riboflavin biosynthesis protein RibF [Apilactobacillus timberlakei]TPR17447.1 riboflavin biosynthesis protein RibF [Apilactobacillus timberlakei]